MSPGDRVLVFDGYCHLCSGWARFLARHPVTPAFRLVAMQGEEGRALLGAHGIDPEDPSTFLVLDAGRVFRESDAVIHVVTALGHLWRVFEIARIIPRPCRDWMYRVLARNRYRWFGRRQVCYLPGSD
ncbi:MAG: thiol-disulfide oxidoreductase DCC family protein [Proteobacteria bacterium]|jgi:predicted DCC family thiol-disulfide oxidoreductase YuxK|nr:thiol-disulfide oxidoreductase DCC family protein [Pseudomonadota bacterium]MBK7114579.1 thiol-disulfide oxidoreductase DCC family protein [Pseudomonadota bacterium]MBK9253309.1 thiol-disulfide oxidoreductase DCC family protein [Pseudomonadota bacterium]MCC6632219.1 thiol-disulfide oxidoreductase DCC family protein [Gammaproteobacteria bacterium]